MHSSWNLTPDNLLAYLVPWKRLHRFIKFQLLTAYVLHSYVKFVLIRYVHVYAKYIIILQLRISTYVKIELSCRPSTTRTDLLCAMRFLHHCFTGKLTLSFHLLINQIKVPYFASIWFQFHFIVIVCLSTCRFVYHLDVYLWWLQSNVVIAPVFFQSTWWHPLSVKMMILKQLTALSTSVKLNLKLIYIYMHQDLIYIGIPHDEFI